MGHRFESCRAHHFEGISDIMQKTIIQNIETGITKNCDILKKNDRILEVILEGTTIKILLKKHNHKYIGKFKEMEFVSTGD